MISAKLDPFQRMLNPAFCGLIVTTLVEGAANGQGNGWKGLPLVSIYLLAPMIFHEKTAESVAKQSIKSMADLVNSNPGIVIPLERLVRNWTPQIRSGIQLAIHRQTILFYPSTRGLVATGTIAAIRPRLNEILTNADKKRIDSALKLGSWAGRMSVVQLCDHLSIRPRWLPIDVDVNKVSTSETDAS